MNKIEESDIGRKVVYTPFEGCDPKINEEGVVTSFKKTTNGRINVFVRYGNDINSKCTSIEQLHFVGK